MSQDRCQLCWGLLSQRKRWGFSARGWIALAIAALVAAFSFIFGVYPFLALTARTNAEVLVVEGWLHEYAIHAAVSEYESGQYVQIVTTGGPIEGLGRYLNDYSTSASVAASRLRNAGVDPSHIAMAPSRRMDRDRTYGAAAALREWLHVHAPAVRHINIITADAHARRSRLLYAKALGTGFTVGVIAVPSPDYDADHWWRYSEGVRSVLSETVAYFYAKVLFFPDAGGS